jgi:nucleotide-binding universal stress UspA family protein
MLQEQGVAAAAARVTIPATQVSFSKIMVATDFSPASERALKYAISIARRFRSKIYLSHVITLDGYPMIAPEIAAKTIDASRGEAEENFARLVESGGLHGIDYHTNILEGAFWPTLDSLINEYKIDLLVLGTRGLGDVKKVILGSGAEEAFRQARIPVLTVGPHAKDEWLGKTEFKNILFATDFGPGVDREAAYAFALAQEHHAQITLLNVVPYVEVETFSEEAVTKQRDWVVRQLKELVPAKANLDYKPEFLMMTGDPVEEILRRADKADLIVMGAKPVKGLAGHVPHTKAYRVISAAKCPVLTIKS